MMKDNLNPAVAFVGCGNMGEALLSGILKGGFTVPEQVTVSTGTPARRIGLAEHYGVIPSESNAACAEGADLIILAVKPVFYEAVIAEICMHLKEGALLLSITPPFTLEKLRSLAERDDITVARSMPNLGASLGLGITAIVEDAELSAENRELLRRFAESVGTAVFVREDQLAGMSSLIGSSPAYLAMVLDALAQGAIELGIPASESHPLAAQAMLATATLILQSGEHPAALRDRVCSAGGTSIAGVTRLEEGFKGDLIDAMLRSAVRFSELEKEASADREHNL